MDHHVAWLGFREALEVRRASLHGSWRSLLLRRRLVACGLLTLTAATVHAATIRGRITNCGEGAPGYSIEAFEEVTIGIEVDDPRQPGGPAPCTNGLPQSRSVGTARSDANGDYAINFTATERPAVACRFARRFSVRVRDPSGRIVWTSSKSTSSVFNRAFAVDCPRPPNDCGDGVLSPLASPDYQISGSFSAPNCTTPFTLRLYAVVDRSEIDDPDAPARELEVELQSRQVNDGDSWSFTFRYCRDFAPLFNVQGPTIEVPVELRLSVPDPVNPTLPDVVSESIDLRQTNSIELDLVVPESACNRTLVRVRGEDDALVQGAQVWVNGTIRGSTTRGGLVSISPALSVGDTIIARRRILERKSHRDHHDQGSNQDWSWRVYITSHEIGDTGAAELFAVSDPAAIQELVLLRRNALIGVHLLASLEWDARDDELATMETRLRDASDYLYDATDGQFYIEQVSIRDNGALWHDTDYRVHANRCFRANVDFPRDGFIDDFCFLGICNRAHMKMAVNNSFRVYIHEFGHYGFDLGDEYEDDKPEVSCTRLANVRRLEATIAGTFQAGEEIRAQGGAARGRLFQDATPGDPALLYTPTKDSFKSGDTVVGRSSGATALATGAPGSPTGDFFPFDERSSCVMWLQSRTRKFCSKHPANRHVGGTNQGDESCWSDIQDVFSDGDDRYFLRSPEPGSLGQRRDILGEIEAVHPTTGAKTDGLPAEWMRVTLSNTSRPGQLCTAEVEITFELDGVPVAVDYLDTRTTEGRVIVQATRSDFCEDGVGLDDNGNPRSVKMTGVHVGDTVRAFVGQFLPGGIEASGSYVITAADCGGSVVLELAPAEAVRSAVTPVPGTSFALVEVDLGGSGAEVIGAALAETAGGATLPVPLTLDPATGIHTARVELPDGDFEGQLQLVATHASGAAIDRAQPIGLHQVAESPTVEVSSPDGSMQLSLAGDLPAGTRVSIGPALVEPPVAPRATSLIVRPFYVGLGYGVSLPEPGRVRLWIGDAGQNFADGAGGGLTELDADSVTIHQYDLEAGTWRAVDSEDITYSPKIGLLSLRTRTLGFFAVTGSTRLEDGSFLRGDTNGDGTVDISDPILSLGALFLGGREIPCEDAADANDDGELNIADPVLALEVLFVGGTIPAPSGECGPDPTDDALGCASVGVCP